MVSVTFYLFDEAIIFIGRVLYEAVQFFNECFVQLVEGFNRRSIFFLVLRVSVFRVLQSLHTASALDDPDV